ncbi:MAG: SGNH/GDSL hydrolase family protein [Ruminococcaceae bacterium]|nr:SGNH/GDSL hydrolase family protein [Oscillospiraceae bacterium]
MELKGLKINFIGDSITQGVGTSAEDKIYLNLLKNEYGLAEARNYGISATRIAEKRKKHDYDTHDYLDFCSRYGKMDDDADVVVVFGGTNDFGHGDAPMGNKNDRTPMTFYGACHTLFRGLLEKFSDSTIVIMTPLHRTNEDNPGGDTKKKENTATLIEYVNVIKEVAAYYSIPVLDLWSVSGIQPNVDVIREKYCPDGLHPNDAGHKLIASRLAGFLKSL